MKMQLTPLAGAIVLIATSYVAALADAAPLTDNKDAPHDVPQEGADVDLQQVNVEGEEQSGAEEGARAGGARERMRERFGRRGGAPGGPQRERDPAAGRRPGFGPERTRPDGPPPRGGPAAAERRPGPDALRIFELFDVDEDGQLSRDEFRRLAEATRLIRGMSQGERPRFGPRSEDRADSGRPPARGRRGAGRGGDDSPRPAHERGRRGSRPKVQSGAEPPVS